MNEEQVAQLAQAYKANPYLFTPGQVSTLERHSWDYGLQFLRDQRAEEFSLLGTVKQLGAGFLSGLTTLQMGDDPSNTYEAIARNVGSLLGFVGYIPGPGLAGKVGATAIGRAIGLGRLARMASAPTRITTKAGGGLSVPMLVGEQAARAVEKISPQAKQWLTQTRLGDVARAGIELGAASAVSSWQQGVDSMMAGLVRGGAEGLGFRALSNFVRVGALGKAAGVEKVDPEMAKGADMAIRAVASSLYSGLPSTAVGEPLELQVYQYLLGAYFGVVEAPFSIRQAQRHIYENIISPTADPDASSQERAMGFRALMLNPGKSKGFSDLPKDVRDEVVTQSQLWWGRQLRLRDGGGTSTSEAIQAKASFDAWNAIVQRAIDDNRPPEEAIQLAGEQFYLQMIQAARDEADLKTILGWQDRYEQAINAGRDHDEAFELASAPLYEQNEIRRRQRIDRKRAEKERKQEEPPAEEAPVVEMAQDLAERERATGAEERRIRDAMDSLTAESVRAALEDHEIPGNVRNSIVDMAIEASRERPDISPGDVLQLVARRFSESYALGEEGYDVALQDIGRELNLNTDPDGETGRALRQAWIRAQGAMQVKAKTLSRGKTEPLGDLDMLGNRRTRFRHPTFLDKLLGGSLIEDAVDLSGNYVAYRSIYDDNLVPEAQVILDSFAGGDPFVAAIKDKGKGFHAPAPLHRTVGILMPDEAGQYRPTVLEGEIAQGSPMAQALKRKLGAISDAAEEPRDTINLLLRDFAEAARAVEGRENMTDAELISTYGEHVLSNIAFYEAINGGIPFETMVAANRNKTGQFVLSPAGITKRMQPLEDGQPPAGMRFFQNMPDVVESGGLRYAIVNEVRAGGRPTTEGHNPPMLGRVEEGRLEQYAALHHLDGVLLLDAESFDALSRHYGLDPEGDFMKLTSAYNNEVDARGSPLGLFIGKLGAFRLDEDASKSLRSKDLRALFYDTAAKQRGFRKKYDYQLKSDFTLNFYREGSKNPNPLRTSLETYVMPIESIRVNTGVSENVAHAIEDGFLVRQFLTNLEDDAAIERAFETFVRPSVEGLPDQNNMVVAYEKAATEAERLALAKKISVDQIGVKELVRIVFPEGGAINGGPLYRKVWEHIMNVLRRDPDFGRMEDVDDGSGMGELIREVDGYNTGAARLLEIAAREGTITPMMIHWEMVEPYALSAMRRYIIRRVTNPHAPFSGSAIIRGQDPWMVARKGYVKEGTFRIGKAAADRKVIQWVSGKRVTLTEAWEDYKKNPTAEKKALLTFAVIRVPSDSISGARMLLYDGDNGTRGAGMSLHNREYIYLGGADNDGDKVFYYQNVDRDTASRPIHDHLKANEAQHDDPRFPGAGAFADSKRGKVAGMDLESLFVPDLPDHRKTVFAGLDPLALLRAGRGARQGNLAMGPMAVAGRRASVLWKKGKYVGGALRGHDIAPFVRDKDFDPNDWYPFSIRLAKDKKDFDRMRMAAMNYAVDASNTGGLKADIPAMQKLLGRALFRHESLVFFGRDDKPLNVDKKALREAITIQIKDTRLGRMMNRADQTISGRERMAYDQQTGEELGLYKPGLWDMLDFLAADSVGPEGEGNTWYKGLNMLRDIPHTKVGQPESGRGRKLVPWLGSQWETRFHGQFKEVMRRATMGDPVYRQILDGVGMKRLSMPDNVRMTDAWQYHNDVMDYLSVLHVSTLADEARKVGTSDADLLKIARNATLFKEEAAMARNAEGNPDLQRTIGLGVITLDDLAQRSSRFRDSLTIEQAAYYDAYRLSTLNTQDQTLGDVLRQAEAEYRSDPAKKKWSDRKINKGWEQARQEVINYYFRTNDSRFAYQTTDIPDEAIARWLRRAEEVFQATWKETLTPEEAQRVSLLSDPARSPVVAAVLGEDQAGNPALAQGEKVDDFFANYFEKIEQADRIMDPKKVGIKQAARNTMLYKELQSILRRNPAVLDLYDDVFVTVSSRMSEDRLGVTPRVSNLDDLQRFIRFMTSVGRGDAIKEVQDGTISEDVFGRERVGDRPWKNYYHLFFPDTIGRKTLPFDLNIGKPVTRKVMTARGIKDIEVRDVFSHIGKAHEFFSNLQQQASGLQQSLAKRRNELLRPYLDALGPDFRQIYEMATATIGYRSRKTNNTGDPHVFEYRKRYGEYIKELANKRYRITDEKGVQREVTGRDLVGTTDGPEGELGKLISDYLDADYNHLVANEEAEAKWLRNDQYGLNPYLTMDVLTDELNRSGEIPWVGMRGMLKIAHELYLQERAAIPADVATDNNVPPGSTLAENRRNLLRTPRGRAQYESILNALRDMVPFSGIGRVERGRYYPQNGHRAADLKEHFKRLMEEHEQAGASMINRTALELALKRGAALGYLDDYSMGEWATANLLGGEVSDATQLQFSPPSFQSRGPVSIPGWDHGPRALERYDDAIVRAYFNTSTAIFGQRIMDSFKRKRVMGEHNSAWLKYLDMYTRQTIGVSSTYPESWFSDKGFRLSTSPTYFLSDHAWEKTARRIDTKFFGGKKFGDSVIGDPRSKEFTRWLSRLSMMEGKWEMMTLLASTRGMANNMVGGTVHTNISTGWRYWRLAGDLSYLQSINPGWKGWDMVDAWIESFGGIESYIAREIHIPHLLRSGSGRKFWDAAVALGQKKGWSSVKDGELLDLAREHGISEAVFDKAAWFMRSVERRLRRRAFLAHYLKARDSLEAHSGTHDYSDPWLIEMAKKGVEGTQFLYDNANRPTFAATSMGRVFTRFQLWALNSVRLRRDILVEANNYGFNPGSANFARFQRLAIADLFMFALASIFPASLFESVLPAPWNHVLDFSDFMFGDEEERDRAFFGDIPWPFSPAQVVLPPITRTFSTVFSALLTNEWERYVDYHMWSLFPFGLLSRTVYKTLDNPVMAVEQLSGFPLHRVHSRTKKMRAREGIRGTYSMDELEAA